MHDSPISGFAGFASSEPSGRKTVGEYEYAPEVVCFQGTSSSWRTSILARGELGAEPSQGLLASAEFSFHASSSDSEGKDREPLSLIPFDRACPAPPASFRPDDVPQSQPLRPLALTTSTVRVPGSADRSELLLPPQPVLTVPVRGGNYWSDTLSQACSRELLLVIILPVLVLPHPLLE